MAVSGVALILIANSTVFLLWILIRGSGLDPQFMVDNFLVSWSALVEGRLWTLLTAAFSHNLFWHLFLNMYVLIGFGSVVEKALGLRRFLTFYVFAAIISSLSHALVSAYVLRQPEIPALGASGAISGVILFFSLLFPRQKISILGLISVPAVVGAVFFVGLDLFGLRAQAGGGGLPIGHGAHLGGALTGVVYYLFFFRHRWEFRSRLNEQNAGPVDAVGF